MKTTKMYLYTTSTFHKKDICSNMRRTNLLFLNCAPKILVSFFLRNLYNIYIFRKLWNFLGLIIVFSNNDNITDEFFDAEMKLEKKEKQKTIKILVSFFLPIFF